MGLDRFYRGLAIPYFLVPLLAPVVGAIIGAFFFVSQAYRPPSAVRMRYR
ncbi:hypothetical protein [Klebsiella pneumoniae IS53]|nr:hypothetical protein [Klebsiella pneumoniae IS53]